MSNRKPKSDVGPAVVPQACRINGFIFRTTSNRTQRHQWLSGSISEPLVAALLALSLALNALLLYPFSAAPPAAPVPSPTYGGPER